MALTAEQLAVAIRAATEVTDVQPEILAQTARLLAWGSAMIERLAPSAPENLKDEAIVSMAGYIYDRPSAGQRTAYANAWVNSGAASLLKPYIQLPAVVLAGAAGEAVKTESRTPGQGLSEAQVKAIVDKAIADHVAASTHGGGGEQPAAEGITEQRLQNQLDARQTAIERRVLEGYTEAIETHRAVATAHQTIDLSPYATKTELAAAIANVGTGSGGGLTFTELATYTFTEDVTTSAIIGSGYRIDKAAGAPGVTIISSFLMLFETGPRTLGVAMEMEAPGSPNNYKGHAFMPIAERGSELGQSSLVVRTGSRSQDVRGIGDVSLRPRPLSAGGTEWSILLTGTLNTVRSGYKIKVTKVEA